MNIEFLICFAVVLLLVYLFNHSDGKKSNSEIPQTEEDVWREGGLSYHCYDDEGFVSVSCANPSMLKGAFTIPSKVERDGVVYEVKCIGFFKGCSGLTSVRLPDSVVDIPSDAFEDCERLKYNEYDGALYLGTLYNPYFALIKARDEKIRSCRVKEGCELIASSAFLGCKELVSVEMPDSVTIIGESAFFECSKLRSVLLSDALKEISYGLFRSSGLTTIALPKSLQTIDFLAFSDCKNLVSVTVPDSVSCVDDNAFAFCDSLTSVVLPKSLENLGCEVFEEDKNMNFSSFDNALYLGCEGNPYFALVKAKDENMVTCEIHESCEIIADSAFEGCAELKKLVIPNSVRFIGAYAFPCPAMEMLTVPDSVTKIGKDAFEEVGVVCYSGNAEGAPWGAEEVRKE